MVANLLIVLFGGIETTESMIGSAMWAVLSHPAIARTVVEDPARIEAVIQESMRWDPAVQSCTRFTTEAVELRGVRIAAGETVQCMLGAANRDPAHFPDPGPVRPEPRERPRSSRLWGWPPLLSRCLVGADRGGAGAGPGLWRAARGEVGSCPADAAIRPRIPRAPGGLGALGLRAWRNPRCIRAALHPGWTLRSALLPRSNSAAILPRRALPAGRLAALGADAGFRHGLAAPTATTPQTVPPPAPASPRPPWPTPRPTWRRPPALRSRRPAQ